MTPRVAVGERPRVAGNSAVSEAKYCIDFHRRVNVDCRQAVRVWLEPNLIAERRLGLPK
jgi:hypothetical protein